MVASLEKLQRAVLILNQRDAPIEERLARAYLFGIAWIYPDAAFAGYEREFDALREEIAHVYYGDRSPYDACDLMALERRVLALSVALTISSGGGYTPPPATSASGGITPNRQSTTTPNR